MQMGRFLYIPAELVAQEAQLALDDNGDKWSSGLFGVCLFIGDSVSAVDVDTGLILHCEKLIQQFNPEVLAGVCVIVTLKL